MNKYEYYDIDKYIIQWNLALMDLFERLDYFFLGRDAFAFYDSV